MRIKKIKKNEKFDLATVKDGMALTANDIMKEVQAEIVAEEQGALRDFIKGALRLSLEKEKEVERLQGEVAKIKDAITKASEGNWDALSAIKIPARFFEEKTLRRHGKSLVSGGEEIRFLDLYVPGDE